MRKAARIVVPMAAVAIVALLPTAAMPQAGTYPEKVIRLVVPFPPGGAIDIMGRLTAQKLSEALGTQVIVDNRSGAGGAIGTDNVARAAPDGYTLLVSSTSPMSINPHINKVPYDPVASFVAIALIASSPQMIVVPPSLPVKNIKDFIAMANARPGAMSFASSGVGTIIHVTAEMFAQRAGIKMLHVPYKGSTPGMTDVIGGNVMSMFPNITTAMPHLKTGRLRALGVTSSKRSDVLPEVPAISETLSGYEALAWFGLFGPAAMPADLVRQVNAEMVRALGDAKVREMVRSQGGDAGGGSPEQFQAFVNAEIVKWAKVIKRAGVEQE